MNFESGVDDKETLIYPGCAYSEINDNHLYVIEGADSKNKNRVPFLPNKKASRIFYDRS